MEAASVFVCVRKTEEGRTPKKSVHYGWIRESLEMNEKRGQKTPAESQAGTKNMGGDFRTESTSHIYVNLILIWLLISDAFVQDDIRNQSQNNQGQ